MEKVVIYAVLTGLSLLIGVAVTLYFKLKQKFIAAVLAFGAGTLICALTFGLMEEAFRHGGFDAVVIGFLLGGSAFIGGDFLIHKFGGRKHKRIQHLESDIEATGKVVTLGSILDNIPESIALGVALVNPGGIGLLMASAIFLSNLPEGIASSSGLKKEGFSNLKIISIWLLVAISVIAITILSYIFLDTLDLNNLGIIESFAAGAILAMVADSMIPEAYEEGGFLVGLITVGGFLTAFLLSKA